MTQPLIIGLGGAGRKIAPQIRDHLGGNMVGVDTDVSILLAGNYEHTLFIGPTTCAGEAAYDPKRGRQAALESREELEGLIKDASRVVLVAGLGGGTGTGAAPVIVEIALSLGVEVVMAAVLSFGFEGRCRKMALKASEELKLSGATLLIHDNEASLQGLSDKKDISVADYFEFSNARVAVDVARLLQPA